MGIPKPQVGDFSHDATEKIRDSNLRYNTGAAPRV